MFQLNIYKGDNQQIDLTQIPSLPKKPSNHRQYLDKLYSGFTLVSACVKCYVILQCSIVKLDKSADQRKAQNL